MSRLIFFLCMFSLSYANAQQMAQIIPQPHQLTMRKDAFKLTAKTRIIASGEASKPIVAFLNEYLRQYYGFTLLVKASGRGIAIDVQEHPQSKDGYALLVSKRGVVITGYSPAGAFYGMQSLIQLLPVASSEKQLTLPGVEIVDEPFFKYRGLHLDVSRHFFPVAFVKKYIDYIALHKMNVFHFHLTDDQGWRIEVKGYPKLMSVGAWRNGTIVGNHPGKSSDGLKHGGFYTQEEIKEIVAYAAQRYVEVIPEIEMPGHASAAIAAYPYLSCFPDESTSINGNTPWTGPREGKQVQQTFGVFEDVFCAGKETTYAFFEDVLKEVMPLFPSKYFHVGGDECPKNNWQRCPLCQQKIKELDLKDEHELQSYLIQRMEKFLNKHGKTIIGWDEILEGGLAPNAIVMSWRGEKGGIEAARQSHQVIMTPTTYAYFDYQQIPKEDSLTISKNTGHLPMQKVYEWKIMPDALDAEQKKFVWGGQANLWTEYITNPAKVEYMIFPRLAALAENLWLAPERKRWEDFKQRLPTKLKRYDLWKTTYCKKAME